MKNRLGFIYILENTYKMCYTVLECIIKWRLLYESRIKKIYREQYISNV